MTGRENKPKAGSRAAAPGRHGPLGEPGVHADHGGVELGDSSPPDTSRQKLTEGVPTTGESEFKLVWLPLLLKAATLGLGVLGLAAIGSTSLAQGLGIGLGREISGHAPAAIVSADTSMAWLAPTTPLAEEVNTRAVPSPTSGAPPPLSGLLGNAAVGNAGASTTPRVSNEANATSAGGAGNVPRASALTADGKVVLNLAGEEELRKLPRVGPKRAEQILALRNRLGRFKSVNDLLRVRGLGVKTLKLMLPMLVLDAPAQASATGGAAGANGR